MLVQSSYNSLGIHEHVFRTREGVLMRVRFELTDFNGRIRGRVLSIEPVITLAGECAKSNCPLLTAAQAETATAESSSFFGVTASPYVFFDFFSSQMTRAPSTV